MGMFSWRIRSVIITTLIMIISIYFCNDAEQNKAYAKTIDTSNIKAKKLAYNDKLSIRSIVYLHNKNDDIFDITDNSRNKIFIGDSRTVGMNKYGIIPSNYIVIAKVGEGYDFLISNMQSLYEANNSDIIINLGVNDLDDISKYINTYRELNNTDKSNNTYYLVSVNPVEDYTTITNEQIEQFNSKLKQLCDESDKFNYIDTYSSLVDKKNYTTDGLHYIKQTYSEIYSMITASIS